MERVFAHIDEEIERSNAMLVQGERRSGEGSSDEQETVVNRKWKTKTRNAFSFAYSYSIWSRLGLDTEYQEAKAAGFSATPSSSLRRRPAAHEEQVEFSPTVVHGRQNVDLKAGTRMVGSALQQLARNQEMTN
ncbi:hypothetical protein ACEQ8H_002020 [Pleosporales sp. CAS-2024a]